MIDWTRVAELRDEIGAEDFDEVAELFLLEVEDTLNRLDKDGNDIVRTQELLHFLKGSALNLGFRDVSQMCSQGEIDAANGVLSVNAAELRKLYCDSRALFEREMATRFAA
ncbi:Hpt domain-containing protein [Marivita hallyeonensis]|uniref:Hpt domain-containing protein n=1 Tax=Marivita hallyeonensis TaxID=996342 RepID=A0A1M5UC84_9RHOB|nr:Hpt domain-containing protein [Marivita hallyeonensis]SHH60632.1 Hpt domain-containing protein [Marivita hallyeonensis]